MPGKKSQKKPTKVAKKVVVPKKKVTKAIAKKKDKKILKKFAKKEEKALPDLMTFSKIANSIPQLKAKALGVVVDATRPYKTLLSSDYVTKLKLIDDTLNQDSKDFGAKRYIHVFFFTPNLNDALNISKLGNIVYLNRFNFKKSEIDQNEYKALSFGKCSKYAVFDGTENKDIAVSSNISANYQPSPRVAKRIHELRTFVSKYFSLHSCPWFGKTKIDQNLFAHMDFDMILKVKAKTLIEGLNEKYFFYQLVDVKNNNYFIDYNLGTFKANDIVKVRSAARLTPNHYLQPNLWTSISKIPDSFHDAKNFKQFNYEIVPLSQLSTLSQYSSNDETETIRTFEEEEKVAPSTVAFATTLKKKWTEKLPKENLSKLVAIKENTLKSKGKAKIGAQLYRVQCNLVQFFPTALKECLVKYCPVTNQIFPSDYPESENAGTPLLHIWQISVALSDSSLNNGDYLDAFIFTYDDNPKDIFPDLDPYKLKITAKTAENFEKGLNSYVGKDVELILEPLINSNDVMFRIIDTKFK